MKGIDNYDRRKKIEIGTDFGTIAINLKDIMDEKRISINTMSRLTNVKYDIVKKYYYGDNYNFNNDILAKFCYILDCTKFLTKSL